MIKISNCESCVVSTNGLTAVATNVLEANFPGQHVLWTDNLRNELLVRVGSNGISAVTPTTIIDEWKRTLTLHGSYPALSVKRHNRWETINYKEYYDECIRFAKALLSLGCEEFSTVNIIGFNAP